jgi:hypothetical protein
MVLIRSGANGFKNSLEIKIRVNDNIGHYFQTRKGLRQGDPLSPISISTTYKGTNMLGYNQSTPSIQLNLTVHNPPMWANSSAATYFHLIGRKATSLDEIAPMRPILRPE